jgi:uncharacterized repeat protein (TIGR01451 family)
MNTPVTFTPTLQCFTLRLLMALGMMLLAAVSALAQTCAPPASFQTGIASGVINTYWAGNGNLPVGATSLTLGTINPNGSAVTPAVGDLLLVMQMQDATMVTNNDSSYGAGTGSGNGSSQVRNAGIFQFVRATAVGANITFTPALVDSYVQDAPNQRSYQVIRVPQYSTATAQGVTAAAWDGTSGGVAAIDVRDTLTLGNGTVELQAGRAFFTGGKGFRGGMGRNGTQAAGFRTDFAIVTGATAGTNVHGTKGEGIAGMPQYVARYDSGWGVQASPTSDPVITLVTSPNFYAGGTNAQGAPGNAGGGGSDGYLSAALNGDNGSAGVQNNQYNSGGGGGGNYGPGGVGGKPWNWSLVDSGGRGGAGYAGTLDFKRVFLGGGGGSGATNNFTFDTHVYANNSMACGSTTLNIVGTTAVPAGKCSSGAAGGGIVVIRARVLTGGGIIDARGANGYNVNNDSGGGGGAGGSVVLQTKLGSVGAVSLVANGGDGGNANGQAVGSGNRHGPGGGGGGGFAAYSPNTMAVNAVVGGGVPGTTINPGEFYDANGYNGGLTTFLTPNIPGVVPAYDCDPNLSLIKSNGVTSQTSPGTTTYTFTVLNSGNSATSGTVSIGDQLPAGLSVPVGALSLTGPNAASWSCLASTTTSILCTSASTISGSATTSFGFAVAVSAANGSSLVNRARVTGGADPLKPTPPDPIADAATCTANDNPIGCALDTDTVTAPNLTLTKTNYTDSLLRGATVSWDLVVTNTGGTATTGAITLLDSLPTGLTWTSTPNLNGFTCSTLGVNLTCTRATALASGASATVSFVAQVLATSPSAVLNLARVGGGGDPNPQKSTPSAASVTACSSPVPPATTSSDPNTGCAADADSVVFVSLSLGKDDGQPFVSAGGTTSYTFIVTNNGTTASIGTITVVDVLPSPTMTFVNPLTVGGTNATDWTCSGAGGTTSSCVSAVTIPPGGNSSYILAANVIPTATIASQLTNRARVGGGSDVTPGMVNSPTFAQVTACTTDGNPLGCAIDFNTVQLAPQIRLSKTHPNPQSHSPGDTFVFTLVITNTGGSTATRSSIDVVDVVPAGLTINSITPAASGPSFTCSFALQIVSCRNGSTTTDVVTTTPAPYQLPAGASQFIQIGVTVNAGATNSLINKAKASGTTDPENATRVTAALASACVSANNPTLGCAVDPVPLNADLQIVKLQRTGSGAASVSLATPVPVGSTVQFVLTVTNTGPSSVTAVQVIDTVPNNFGTVSWVCGTSTVGASCGAVTSGAGNAVSLTTGVLPSGGVINVTVTATASTATNVDGVTNTASLTVPTGVTDGTPTNNISSVGTRVGSAFLAITKSNGVASLIAGSTTTYTIVVTNSGDFPADGSRLYDAVAAGLSCTAPPTCLASGAGTSCPPSLTVAQLQNSTGPTGVAIPTFGPGGTLTLTYICGVTATGQ